MAGRLSGDMDAIDISPLCGRVKTKSKIMTIQKNFSGLEIWYNALLPGHHLYGFSV